MSDHVKTSLEIWSLRFDLAVKGTICLLVFTLIFWPGAIHSALAPYDEVSVFGVKIKINKTSNSELQRINTRLNETLDEVATLRTSSDNLTSLLVCMANDSCNTNQNSEIVSLVGADSLPTTKSSILSELQDAIIETQNSADSWIIAVGADKTHSSAENELKKLTEASFDGEIVRRGS